MTNPNDDFIGSADGPRDPLASHIDGFAALLRGQGYVAESVRQKCALLADLSQWLGVRGLPLSKVDEALVGRFHTDYCPPGRQQIRRGRAATTSQILNYLRDLGCIPSPSVTIGSSPVDVLLGDFEKSLRSERGLAPATLKNYLPIVRRFLVERPDSHVLCFDELRATDLHGFIIRSAQRGSLGRAKLTVTAMRSFLRFLRQRGILATDLAAAMPSVANWRLSHLPKTLVGGVENPRIDDAALTG